MNGPQILAIDLRMPERVFKEDLQNTADSAVPPMKLTMKEMQMRQSGKEMLKVSVDNEAGSSNFTFVVERDINKGEVILTPFKLRSMDNSFFVSRYDNDSIMGTDDDTGDFCLDFLNYQCINRHGSIAYITSEGGQVIIRDGERKGVKGFALVDSENNLYTTTNAKSLSGDIDDDTGPSFKVKTPINVWLRDHPEVQSACSQIQGIGEKMDYIGQYLIQARLSDEIDQEEFNDVFRQAGILGFTNISIQRIYKLLT